MWMYPVIAGSEYTGRQSAPASGDWDLPTDRGMLTALNPWRLRQMEVSFEPVSRFFSMAHRNGRFPAAACLQ
jgi:hypothetical protein